MKISISRQFITRNKTYKGQSSKMLWSVFEDTANSRVLIHRKWWKMLMTPKVSQYCNIFSLEDQTILNLWSTSGIWGLPTVWWLPTSFHGQGIAWAAQSAAGLHTPLSEACSNHPQRWWLSCPSAAQILLSFSCPDETWWYSEITKHVKSFQSYLTSHKQTVYSFKV